MDQFLEDAAELGIPPCQAIDWTLREYRAYAAGAARREAAAAQRAMWTAWHTAQFQRAKKLPKLEPILRKIDRTRRRPQQKSPQQLLQIAKMITAQMSGGKGKR